MLSVQISHICYQCVCSTCGTHLLETLRGQEEVRALVVFLHLFCQSRLHILYVCYQHTSDVAFHLWNSSLGVSDGSGICASSGGVSLSMLSEQISHMLSAWYSTCGTRMLEILTGQEYVRALVAFL